MGLEKFYNLCYNVLMNKLDETYILKIAKKVISQAEQGIVRVGEWKFCVSIDLDLLQYKGHTLNLSDANFLNKVGNYLSLAREFYSNDKDYYELNDESFDEKLFMDLFVNMTNFDIENIDVYLSQRTKMLLDKNNYTTEPIIIGALKHSVMEISILKNTSNLEAPLRFRTILRDGEERFLLPDITFGVVDDCLHVYAIQGKRDEQKNRLAKEFDRYFRKFGKGVDMSDDVLANVSANALASATIFMAYFKQKNMNNVKVYGFMPIRYNSKVSTATMKYEDENQLNTFLEKNDAIQGNITNKFYYTMLRYAYHFGQTVEFDEFHECLDMKLEKNKVGLDVLQEERNAIYDLDESVTQCLTQSVEQENIL